MIAVIALPTMAQITGNGYYRLQNNNSKKRYLSIANNKVDETNKSALLNGSAGNVFALKMVSDPISDPGSIIYIIKESDGYTLEAQGMNTSKLTGGMTLKVYTTDQGDWLYGTKAGTSRYLTDSNVADGYVKVVGSNDRKKPEAYWTFKPVDQVNEFIGVTPDIKINDKYYTTLYASFPYELSDGMKAYYINNDNIDEGGNLAEIKEINKKVPASTPVIIECKSQDPADNKVTPLMPNQAPSKVSGNKLKGVYFCFIKYRKEPEENTNLNEIKNVVEYDAATMRVLGVKDGKLSLVKASDDQLVVTNIGKYLPANKAYFTVASSSADNILLLDKEGYDEAIKTITDNQATYKRNEDDNSVSLVSGNNVSATFEIPETVTAYDGTSLIVNTIADEAFINNNSLKQVTIAGTVTKIDKKAFAGCTSLKTIIIKGETPPELTDANSVFEGVDYETCILYVPEGSIEKYKNAEGWCNFKNILAITAGINDIRMDEKASDIFNLHGHKIQRQASSVNQLPQGVYIINGKKIIKK